MSDLIGYVKKKFVTETGKPETEEMQVSFNSWEDNLLMEEHGAVGELKADGNIAKVITYQSCTGI